MWSMHPSIFLFLLLSVVLEPNTGDNEDYYRVNAFQMHQASEFDLLHNTQRRNNIYG